MKKMLHELQRGHQGPRRHERPSSTSWPTPTSSTSRCPTQWGEGGVGYPSLKPLASWFKDFVHRCKFMHTWLTTQPPKLLLDPGLLLPAGLPHLGAADVRAPATRSRSTCSPSTAHVKPVTRRSRTRPGPPEDGVYVHGMFVEGARFDAAAGARWPSRTRASSSRPCSSCT